MNNLSSYCGLVDAKIRASDKDLPVREQMSSPNLHVFTLKFLALQKLVFPHKIYFPKFFDLCLPLFYFSKKF